MPKIMSEILKLLLDSDLTTAEIADRLGKKRNKYSIDAHLKEMVSEGLIRKSRIKVGRGRPPSLYSFKRDLATVLRAYESYPEIRDELRSREWVRKLLKEKFRCETEELDEMLRLSPTFFEFAVKADISNLAHSWYNYLNNPTELEMLLTHDAFRVLFFFCVFLDEVEGKASADAFKLIRKFSKESILRNFETEMQMLIEAVSSELMTALKQIAKFIRSGDGSSLTQLLMLIDWYEKTEEMHSKAEGEESYLLARRLNEIFNMIASLLGIHTFRQSMEVVNG